MTHVNVDVTSPAEIIRSSKNLWESAIVAQGFECEDGSLLFPVRIHRGSPVRSRQEMKLQNVSIMIT